MQKRCSILLSTTICLLAPFASAQQNHAPERLLAARASYYTPTTAGLKSFQCAVTFDWKDYLTRFSGKTITDDNPALIYLKATTLSVSDNLQHGGSLSWVNTATPPTGKASAFQQMRDGMMQMFGGYFTAWNGYMNGIMVPAPDATLAVAPDANGGVELHSITGPGSFTEKFDKDMLLTEAHILDAQNDIRAYPTYQESPDGRIIVSVRNVIHSPPTAAETDLTMSTTYAKVGAFQLPASVNFNYKNIGYFTYGLSNCVVNKATK